MSKQLATLVPLMLALACGGGEDTNTGTNTDSGTGSSSSSSKTAWDASKGTATITGTVSFVGETPRARPTKITEAHCAAHYGDGQAPDETILVKNGKLQNVVIWIRKGLENWKFETPKTSAHLDQDYCRYVPHVQAIQVGQKLEVHNSDPVMHNVHVVSKRNKSENFSQSTKGETKNRVYKKREVAIMFKCDVHGWMKAWVAVLDNPFFQVTGEDGKFTLAGLPAGTYELEAWHEEFGTQKQTVTVGDKDTKTVDFKFQDN